MAYSTVRLTGTFQGLTTAPAQGYVMVTPSRDPLTDSVGNVILTGTTRAKLDEFGQFGIDLPATDDPNLGTPFTYHVLVSVTSGRWSTWALSLPGAVGTFDLADVPDGNTIEYVTSGVMEAKISAAAITTLSDAGDYTDQEVATRALTVHDHTRAQISDASALGRTLMGVADAQAGRTALDITVDTSVGTRVMVGGVMVHGDTGWRDIGAELQSGFTAYRGLYLSRIGNRVSLEGNLVGTAATDDLLYTLLPGFRIVGGSYVLKTILGSQAQMILRVNSGVIETESRAGRDSLLFSWTTKDPWPSTLPGIPA